MIKELAKENNYINIFLSLKSVIILHTYISTDICFINLISIFLSLLINSTLSYHLSEHPLTTQNFCVQVRQIYSFLIMSWRLRKINGFN